MTTLPNPKDPQVGDRFTNAIGVTWEIRCIDGDAVLVLNPANGARDITKLHDVAAWTPFPPPTPGPDEVWVAMYPNGAMSTSLTAEDAGMLTGGMADVVRYVKAADQTPGGQS